MTEFFVFVFFLRKKDLLITKVSPFVVQFRKIINLYQKQFFLLLFLKLTYCQVLTHLHYFHSCVIPFLVLFLFNKFIYSEISEGTDATLVYFLYFKMCLRDMMDMEKI